MGHGISVAQAPLTQRGLGPGLARPDAQTLPGGLRAGCGRRPGQTPAPARWGKTGRGVPRAVTRGTRTAPGTRPEVTPKSSAPARGPAAFLARSTHSRLGGHSRSRSLHQGAPHPEAPTHAGPSKRCEGPEASPGPRLSGNAPPEHQGAHPESFSPLHAGLLLLRHVPLPPRGPSCGALGPCVPRECSRTSVLPKALNARSSRMEAEQEVTAPPSTQEGALQSPKVEGCLVPKGPKLLLQSRGDLVSPHFLDTRGSECPPRLAEPLVWGPMDTLGPSPAWGL